MRFVIEIKERSMTFIRSRGHGGALLVTTAVGVFFAICAKADVGWERYCNEAEAVQKSAMTEELGSSRAFERNRCASENVRDLPDGKVLVVASYDTPVGFSPYIALFSGDDLNVLCESVDEACAKNPSVTRAIQDELQETVAMEVAVDGVWGDKTEQGLWRYAESEGMGKTNADLGIVILALMGGDVRPLQ